MSRCEAKTAPFATHQNGAEINPPTVVVVATMGRGGQGEYAEAIRTCGGEPMRFAVGEGGVLLDPMLITAAGSMKENP